MLANDLLYLLIPPEFDYGLRCLFPYSKWPLRKFLVTPYTVIYNQLPLIKCPKRDILQINCPETNEIARSIRFVNSIPTQVSCEYLTSLEFHLFLSADSFNAHTELLNIFWNATLVPLIPISFFKHVVESFIVQFVKFTSRNFLCCKFYNCLSMLFISLLNT